MDAESVRSGRSDRSGRYVGRAGGSPHRPNAPPSRPPPPSAEDRDSDPADGSSAVGAPQPPPRAGHGHHRHRARDHARAPRAVAETELDDRDTTDRERDLLRREADADDTGGTRTSPGEAPDDDDAWMETTTAVTTGTTTTFSEAGFSSVENMSRLNKNLELSVGFACARYAGAVVSGIIGLLAYVSPIIMIVLPKTGVLPNMTSSEEGASDCNADCEGLLIGFAFKMVILLAGSWALFCRRPRATLPRVSVFRAIIVLFVFVLTVAFWLFYGVRILSETGQSYTQLVQFGVSMADTLLFTHYVAVVMLELRPLQQFYVVKLMRSPDGTARSYTVGQLSVQRLALHCLDQYYRDFEVYNPYLENAMTRRRSSRMTDFKVYNVDAGVTSDTALSGGGGASARGGVVARAGSTRSGARGHNDRFYDELDYERKLRKRKARLNVAAEEAFNHVTRLHSDKGSAMELSPTDAAQAIFPAIARPLQKYLRTTRQQPRYSGESILNHLSLCIGHGLGAKAFIEPYLSQMIQYDLGPATDLAASPVYQLGAVIWNDKECGTSSDTHTWTVVSASSLSGGISDGTTFRMQRGNVALFATVRKLPHFNLTEDVFSAKNNKFALQLSSETSV